MSKVDIKRKGVYKSRYKKKSRNKKRNKKRNLELGSTIHTVDNKKYLYRPKDCFYKLKIYYQLTNLI